MIHVVSSKCGKIEDTRGVFITCSKALERTHSGSPKGTVSFLFQFFMQCTYTVFLNTIHDTQYTIRNMCT
jgi:hypothetical protein